MQRTYDNDTAKSRKNALRALRVIECNSQPPLRPRRHRDDKHPFILPPVKIPWTILHSLLGMKQRHGKPRTAQTTPMD